MDFIDPEAKDRIERREISIADIEFCKKNYSRRYMNRENIVYCVTLPDGRNLKVEFSESETISNAFCHM